MLGSGFQFVRLELIPLVALLTKFTTPPLWAPVGMFCERDTTPSHPQGGLQTVSSRGRGLPYILATHCHVERRGY